MPGHDCAPPAGTRRGAKDEHIGGALDCHSTASAPPSATTHRAAALLDRLDKVKSTGPGRWVACCPAHADRSPSLSIRETGDGTLLVHCFSGCGAAEVLSAVGMELRDLFAERPEHRKPMKPGERWVPRDVLRALSEDLLFAVIALEHFNRGEKLGDDDIDRLSRAEKRVRAAAREVGLHV